MRLPGPVRPLHKLARDYREDVYRTVVEPARLQLQEMPPELWSRWTPTPVPEDLARTLARRHVRRVNRYHFRRLVTTIRQATGIDVEDLLDARPEDDADLPAWAVRAVPAWNEGLTTPAVLRQMVVNNVALIKTIPAANHAHLIGTMRRLQPSLDQQALKQALARTYGSTGYNLRRLTRDQTNKTIGQLTQHRHGQLHIRAYRWETAGDERVRTSHAANNGRRFDWARAPGTGHPGWGIQCRCVALPELDADLPWLRGTVKPPPPRVVKPTPKPVPQQPESERLKRLKAAAKNDPGGAARRRPKPRMTDAEAEQVRLKLVAEAEADDKAWVERTVKRQADMAKAKKAGDMLRVQGLVREQIRARKPSWAFRPNELRAKHVHSRRYDPPERFKWRYKATADGKASTSAKPKFVTDAVHQKMEAAVDALGRMFDRDLSKLKVEVFVTKGRAWARQRKSNQGWHTIAIDPDDPVNVIVHELSHVVEFSDSTIRKRNLSHLQKRTKGESQYRLSQLANDPGYRANEYAWGDEFMSPYVGKNYGVFSTEVLSMGVEEMFLNPARLAVMDPRLFRHILRELRYSADDL